MKYIKIHSPIVLFLFLDLIYKYEQGIYDIIRDSLLFKFKTNKELKEAVDEWCNPEIHEYAKNKYGHISLWNTSLITDIRR